MSKRQGLETAEHMERRKAKLARRARKERIWNIVLLVIAIAFVVTFISIQISHHI